MNVADALIPKTYASGEVIVSQGDPADGMYFIEGGICEVFVEGGSGNRMKVSYFNPQIPRRYSKDDVKSAEI